MLSVADAERLWRSQAAIFIDVLPRPRKPAGLPSGTLWIDKPRRTIPGALWLPNVGFGDPDKKTLYIAARTGIYKIRVLTPGI